MVGAGEAASELGKEGRAAGWAAWAREDWGPQILKTQNPTDSGTRARERVWIQPWRIPGAGRGGFAREGQGIQAQRQQ